MKKKIRLRIAGIILVMAILLSMIVVSAENPELGVIVNGQWKITVDGLTEESIDFVTLSKVPVVNRKVYIDAGWNKSFPYFESPDWDKDGNFIGDRGYGLIEEFTVPVGTVFTYTYSIAGWSMWGLDGVLIEELFYSHTAEDGIDFYSHHQLNEDGSYKSEYSEEWESDIYIDTTSRVFEYFLRDIYDVDKWDEIESEEKTVSFTFDKTGLYGIHTISHAVSDITDDAYYFVINVVAGTEKPSSWAIEQVNAAITAGLVPQTLQSRYTQATTRADFCALAVALYENIKGEITGRTTFIDTNDVNVQKMAFIGVVSGVGNNRFDPNASLTREQAAAVLMRLADVIGKPFPKQSPTFSDIDISSWATESIGSVQAAGIMGGVGDNRFAPQGEYTREQSIVTIMRLFEYLK